VANIFYYLQVQDGGPFWAVRWK